MRTRPLPNRHAADLSDFMECVQATLNRNKSKGDLEDMDWTEIIDKIDEEVFELKLELSDVAVRGYNPKGPERVEREAADLAVCALAAWIWARRGERGGS